MTGTWSTLTGMSTEPQEAPDPAITSALADVRSVAGGIAPVRAKLAELDEQMTAARSAAKAAGASKGQIEEAATV